MLRPDTTRMGESCDPKVRRPSARSWRAQSSHVCSHTYPVGKLPGEESAIKGEGKGPEGRDVAWQDASGQAAAMYPLNPIRFSAAK
jgi:hypothetical protein